MKCLWLRIERAVLHTTIQEGTWTVSEGNRPLPLYISYGADPSIPASCIHQIGANRLLLGSQQRRAWWQEPPLNIPLQQLVFGHTPTLPSSVTIARPHLWNCPIPFEWWLQLMPITTSGGSEFRKFIVLHWVKKYFPLQVLNLLVSQRETYLGLTWMYEVEVCTWPCPWILIA